MPRKSGGLATQTLTSDTGNFDIDQADYDYTNIDIQCSNALVCTLKFLASDNSTYITVLTGASGTTTLFRNVENWSYYGTTPRCRVSYTGNSGAATVTLGGSGYGGGS